MTEFNKAVFLDRDGVINQAYDFRPPNHAGELVLFPGVPEAIRAFNEAGYLVFVVTNQGGVGLGYMTEADLAEIHRKLSELVVAQGGKFTEIRACTHKPRAGCDCRKPEPGMILALAEKYNVDLKASFMVGDRDVDLQAGQRAGVQTVLITSSETITEKFDYSFSSLLAASEFLIGL